MDEGKTDSARQVVTYVEQVIPPTTVPHCYASGSMDLARVWEKLGEKHMVDSIARPIAQTASEYMDWYLSLPQHMIKTYEDECIYNLYQLHHAADLLQKAGSDSATEYIIRLNQYNDTLQKYLYGAAADLSIAPTSSPAVVPTEEEGGEKAE